MNTKHTALATLAIAAVLAGCAKSPFEDVNPSERLADLELSHVGAIETKAAIDGTTFPTSGEIGLFLFKDEGAIEAYGESGYANVKYAFNSTKEKWTASPSIKVGSTPGYLFGYYPYSSIATDIKAIPVSSSLNGDDAMYVTSQTVTDKTASQTEITMNHVLARISIKVVNNGYTGNAKLSKITFSGACTAPTGMLNALDGSISAEKNDVTLDVAGDAQTITASGTTYECLLVPSGVESGPQELDLTLTIDGQDKTASFSGNDNGVIISQGVKSNITITLSNNGISVQSVSVEDWNVIEIGGHKVAIQIADGIDPNDILTKAYVDGDNVIIKAYSETANHLKCIMPDGEFCTSQSKTDKLVYTFTISDITENTTATIGYAKAGSIALSPADAGCKVTVKDGELYEGETVTLAQEAEYKYGFVNWKDKNGNILSEDYDYTFRLPQNEQITACFEENLILSGVFTVGEDHGVFKKVRFTRGNLYFDESSKIEKHQYDFGEVSKRDENHISHFMWCTSMMYARQKEYDKYFDSTGDIFFTEEEGFTVDGFNANQCRTLTKEEWTTLFEPNDYVFVPRKYKLGVKVCGSENCAVLLPDGWKGDIRDLKEEYNYVEWKHMEAAGAVCLPSAGYRYGGNDEFSSDIVYNTGLDACYWSSTYKEDNKTTAYYMKHNGFSTESRSMAYAVRLVIDVTE